MSRIDRYPSLATDRETYRIQSVEEEHFFGTVTHKNLQLVKLNGR